VADAVPKPESKRAITMEAILAYPQPRVAKWWLPDEVRFTHEIPKTSVGKFDKLVLREAAARHQPAVVPSE